MRARALRVLDGPELERALLSLTASRRCCGSAEAIRDALEYYGVTASEDAIEAALEAIPWERRRAPSSDDYLLDLIRHQRSTS